MTAKERRDGEPHVDTEVAKGIPFAFALIQTQHLPLSAPCSRAAPKQHQLCSVISCTRTHI